MFRAVVVFLTLAWFGLMVLMMPDLIRATASAGNARLMAIQKLQEQKPGHAVRNQWF